ncbi:MAG: hypothetical protein NT154_47445, partial [Verrucomicrobia bacterium]|nr:hypothetical protein [Verrucomicrobiota bacterium]
MAATVAVHVVAQPVHYVAWDSKLPVSPYSSWATAATNIQDAVDAATVTGASLLVSNGLYQTGGRAVYGSMTNRVAVTKPLVVRSFNGPGVTLIKGYQMPGTINGNGAVRCVYLTNGATLTGFTLTNGATSTSGDNYQEVSGGGVWCVSTLAVVSNCVLVGNSASTHGGGACNGTLNNCTLTGNSARGYNGSGGAAFFGMLNNCKLTGNSASYYGGGAEGGTLSNCTLMGNSAYYNGGGAYFGMLNNCTLSGNSASDGGGTYSCTLNNCTLTGNSAGGYLGSGGAAYFGMLNNCTLSGNSASSGGGANSATLNNCTLTGNSASSGGGAYDTALNNCIVYYNTDNTGRNGNWNYGSSSILNYCCTVPLPPNGTNNLTAEPQLASISHLSTGSPCRGAGSANYATGTDVDGEPWASHRPSVATS